MSRSSIPAPATATFTATATANRYLRYIARRQHTLLEKQLSPLHTKYIPSPSSGDGNRVYYSVRNGLRYSTSTRCVVHFLPCPQTVAMEPSEMARGASAGHGNCAYYSVYK